MPTRGGRKAAPALSLKYGKGSVKPQDSRSGGKDLQSIHTGGIAGVLFLPKKALN
jgi:hypothetical protein